MCVLREVGTVGVYVDYVLGVMLSQSLMSIAVTITSCFHSVSLRRQPPLLECITNRGCTYTSLFVFY